MTNPTTSISRNRLDATMEAVDAAILTIDSHGIIIECNRATSRLFGFDEPEMLGQNVKMLMPEPYQSSHDQYIDNHLTTGINRIIGSGRKVSGKHKNGNVFPLHLSVAKFDDAGSTYFTGILHDLTELDYATSMSNKLGQIVDEANNEVYTYGIESLKFTSANRAAQNNLGYSRDDLLTMTPMDIIDQLSESAHRETIQPLIEGSKKRIAIETRHRRSDGTTYDVIMSLHYSTALAPPEMVALVQDVSEKKKLEESVRRHQRMESIGNLTGGIAHDFHNILTVVMGNLDLLQDELEKAELLELVKDAQEAAEMGARLTKRLLAFARRSPLSPEGVNVNSVIEDLSTMLTRTLGGSVQLESVLAPDIWITKVDVSELENALVNLAVNARDAMPDGGRLIVETSNCQLDDTDIVGKEIDPGAFVKIVVTDTGHGIPKDLIETIFEPFVTTKHSSKGSGLGLSMVYGFARQSGGSVSVYSEHNQGTVFTLYLPKSESSVEQSNSQAAESVPKMQRKTVLVAEDEDRVRKLTRRRLEKLGHDVILAANGYEALALFKQNEHIDIVFTDVVMTEGMSGYDLAMAVRELNPDIPVLLTSGYAEDIVNNEKLKTHGLLLLRKPYHQTELQDMLLKTLNRSS